MPDNSSYSVTLARPAPLFAGRFSLLVAVLLTALAMAAIANASALSGPRGSAALSTNAGQGRATTAIAPGPTQLTSEALWSQQTADDTPVVVQAEAPAPVVVEPEAPAPAAIAAAVQTQAGAVERAAPQQATATSPVLPGDRWLAEGFIFVMDGQEWDAGSVANVDAALSRLPASVRTRLGNKALGPVNIVVNRSGRSLSGKQPYGGPANFFSTNDGDNELVLFPGQSVLTILHELGHAFNLRNVAAARYATVLLDPEMQSFMNATGWRILSTPDEIRAARDQMQVQTAYEGAAIWPKLSHNDPLEDFANSFALYFFAPEQLQQKSLERFEWFEGLMSR